MGIASLTSDSVPATTFTPQEPLVEVLRVSLAKDAVLVMAAPQVKANQRPNPTTSIYNASIVKIYNATNSMARF
jgi:hypothetical protein